MVGDHVVHTPFLSGSVERVFPDLEPLQSGLARCRSIVNLRKPCRDGTLVRCRDRVVGVVGELRTADDMAEVSANVISALDIDDLV